MFKYWEVVVRPTLNLEDLTWQINEWSLCLDCEGAAIEPALKLACAFTTTPRQPVST